jgi:DNA-binding CsgD family transcriptional regulator
MTRFLDQHPDLDDKERGMIILTALGMRSSSIAVCLGLKSDSVVRSLRHRLAKRLDLDIPLTDYLEGIVKNRPFL